jgi:hypothetical protein
MSLLRHIRPIQTVFQNWHDVFLLLGLLRLLVLGLILRIILRTHAPAMMHHHRSCHPGANTKIRFSKALR